MFPAGELLQLILQSLPSYVRRPELLAVVGVVLFLVYRQYRRVVQLETHVLGRPLASAGARTAEAILVGLGGGALATVLFIVVGLSLNDMGVWYLWPVAILLFFLHPRFLCFAYAGGIVSVVHLATGWPDVHVPSVMALVAILHLVEAVLIGWHGARQATPVYVRRQKGDVVGGFTLQKFWPIPFVAMLTLVLGAQLPVDELLEMPDWWPLIASPREVPPGSQLVYMLFPVVAALGYGDIALTRTPEEKARRSALVLFAYSVGLMGLAVLADHVPFWAWPAALFSPLAHEGVIAWGRASEERGKPLFVGGGPPLVMDVLPGSPAHRLGIRRGDRIVEVNGQPVMSKAAVHAALLEARRPVGWGPPQAGVEVVAERGGDPPQRLRWTVTASLPLGIVLAPEPYEAPSVDLRDRSRYAQIAAGLKRWAGRFIARA